MFNNKTNSNQIRNTRKAQEEHRALLNTPLKGRKTLRVMKVNYCEAEIDEKTKEELKPERMHIFCRVIRRDGTYDPRPVNCTFGKWKGVDPVKFDVLMDNLQAATNVNTPGGLRGKVLSAVLRPKEYKNAPIKDQYLMSWFEAAEAPSKEEKSTESAD